MLNPISKRIFDVILSAALLLLAAPVLLFAAAIIWLTSPGPVLFRQTRMGRGFKTFQILKLRTMIHGELGAAYTFGPDPRITPFGDWLRRTKLDELPQLWNVLRGEMSLVGPRPVIPDLTMEFRPQYELLLLVRPGLTDPASIEYRRETQLLADRQDAMELFKTVVTPAKIDISLAYLQKADLWSDLSLIVRTAWLCFTPAFLEPKAETLHTLLAAPSSSHSLPTSSHANASAFALASPKLDGAIFSYELAALEATEGEDTAAYPIPWHMLPPAGVRGAQLQAAPSRSPEQG